jgi:hypothetical protein
VGPRAGLDKGGKSRPPPKFNPRTIQSVASRYTEYIISAVTNNNILLLLLFFIIVVVVAASVKVFLHLYLRPDSTAEEPTTEPVFEVRHPRCVSTKSNYKVYAYIVKHNYT